MLTTRMKRQLILFAVIALAATSYLGAKYVGIDPTASSYRVTVDLPEAGGTFDNGEVTYRGVPVGRIQSLEATDDGAQLVLRLDGNGPKIPSDVKVTVNNRSAIGEQYVDLGGTTTSTTDLKDGDRIRAGDAALPPPVDELLRVGRNAIASVDSDSLTTVIDEAYDATRGSADDVARLIDTSLDFVTVAQQNLLATTSLIENSATVLQTQQASGASIRSFSSDLDLIAGTLEKSDGDLRTLIANSPIAAQEVGRLIDQVGRPLGTLLGNLITPAQVFGINAAGLEDTLVRAPEALSVGWSVVGSQGIDLSLAQTFFDPLPCTTGYGGTAVRPGTDTSPGAPFNTQAGCALDPSSGVNVRGPRSTLPAGGAPATARVSVPQTLSDLLGGAR